MNRWEYCFLERVRYNIDPNRKNVNQELTEQIITAYCIRYCGGGGNAFSRVLHTVTTKNAPEYKDQFLFGKLLGALGNGGWEMVSVLEQADHFDVSSTTAVYLKRPAVEGRAVDEPRLDT